MGGVKTTHNFNKKGTNMQITLYNNTSENNRLNKNLIKIITLDGNLKSDTNIINPIIDFNITDISKINYAYIPEFNRYYFIKDIVNNYNNQFTIYMHVDVLMSNNSEIILCKGITDESTSQFNNYIQSNNWVSTVKDSTSIIPFSNGLLDTGEFILITSGG